MRQACCLWVSPDSTPAAAAAQSEWWSGKQTVNVELTFNNLSHHILESGHLENKLARAEAIYLSQRFELQILSKVDIHTYFLGKQICIGLVVSGVFTETL